MKRDQTTTPDAPFHRGEQEMQARVGKRDKLEGIGRRVIRPYMPDQHRDFFSRLPYMVVGSVDVDGWPWASMLFGTPGFVQSSSATSLEIQSHPTPGDPLETALAIDSPLGMLGIEVSSRRRNRLNGIVSSTSAKGFAIQVQQSFGNCPKYIQRRDLELVSDTDAHTSSSSQSFTSFDESTQTLLHRADTFFVSSYVAGESDSSNLGVDVSHRGGPPGFVRVNGNTLTIPDYAGNSFFNTMGNFLITPKAGLLFIDFESRDLVLLTGDVELLGEDHPEVRKLASAERGWKFTLRSGVRLRRGWPFETSPPT